MSTEVRVLRPPEPEELAQDKGLLIVVCDLTTKKIERERLEHPSAEPALLGDSAPDERDFLEEIVPGVIESYGGDAFSATDIKVFGERETDIIRAERNLSLAGLYEYLHASFQAYGQIDGKVTSLIPVRMGKRHSGKRKERTFLGLNPDPVFSAKLNNQRQQAHEEHAVVDVASEKPVVPFVGRVNTEDDEEILYQLNGWRYRNKKRCLPVDVEVSKPWVAFLEARGGKGLHERIRMYRAKGLYPRAMRAASARSHGVMSVRPQINVARVNLNSAVRPSDVTESSAVKVRPLSDTLQAEIDFIERRDELVVRGDNTDYQEDLLVLEHSSRERASPNTVKNLPEQDGLDGGLLGLIDNLLRVPLTDDTPGVADSPSQEMSNKEHKRSVEAAWSPAVDVLIGAYSAYQVSKGSDLEYIAARKEVLPKELEGLNYVQLLVLAEALRLNTPNISEAGVIAKAQKGRIPKESSVESAEYEPNMKIVQLAEEARARGGTLDKQQLGLIWQAFPFIASDIISLSLEERMVFFEEIARIYCEELPISLKDTQKKKNVEYLMANMSGVSISELANAEWGEEARVEDKDKIRGRLNRLAAAIHGNLRPRALDQLNERVLGVAQLTWLRDAGLPEMVVQRIADMTTIERMGVVDIIDSQLGNDKGTKMKLLYLKDFMAGLSLRAVAAKHHKRVKTVTTYTRRLADEVKDLPIAELCQTEL